MLNEGEKKLVEFQLGMSGSFYENFFKAAFKADGINFQKLRKGFPEEMNALRKYRMESGYWDKIKKEYLELK